jgi:hypothetical protein
MTNQESRYQRAAQRFAKLEALQEPILDEAAIDCGYSCFDAVVATLNSEHLEDWQRLEIMFLFLHIYDLLNNEGNVYDNE